MTDRSELPVLLVGNFLSEAGGSRGICEELAARLPGAGCAVVTTSSQKPKLFRLVDMVGTTWLQRHRYAVAQVDVFSGPAFFWAEAVCATLRRARKPYVLTLHGGDLPRFSSRRPARVERLLLSAAAVTAPSRYMLGHFSRYRDDIRVIPNGVDVGAYSDRPRSAGGPRLVWLRAFHRIYNPSLAVRMLALVSAQRPDVRLTMIGPDKGDGSRQTAERLAAELGVSGRVDFRPGVPKHDVPNALRNADIFINTSDVDNTPVTLVEAMASGLCIVSTNVGGVPDLVDDGRDAILVGRNDPDAMAREVLRLLDEPDLAARLSRDARRKAEQFDWSPIIGTWRSLLSATAARAA